MNEVSKLIETPDIKGAIQSVTPGKTNIRKKEICTLWTTIKTTITKSIINEPICLWQWYARLQTQVENLKR